MKIRLICTSGHEQTWWTAKVTSPWRDFFSLKRRVWKGSKPMFIGHKPLYGLYFHGEETNTSNGPFNSIQHRTHIHADTHSCRPWTSVLSAALWLMWPLYCRFCPWNSMSDLETHSPTPPSTSALHPTPLLYLKPLPVRLHLQHHAGVGFGEGVAVRDAPAGNSQLHFGQAWRADEAQSGLGRLIDVTHVEHTITRWKERERMKTGLVS